MPRTGRPRTCDCGICRKCKHRDNVRAWYARKTTEERRALRKNRSPDLRQRHNRNPLFNRANYLTNNAIRDGRLTREPCFCGKAKVDAHHNDYSKPLEVEWLCRPHHHERHGFTV